MNKEQFLAAVGARIGALPPEDIARSLDYYREMIDDRMEDGMSEAEAVAAMGSVDEVVDQILAGAVFVHTSPDPEFHEPYEPRPEAQRRRGMSGWMVLLLILGSPLWLPLTLAAGIVVLALFIAVWAVVFALGVTAVSLAVGGVAAIVGGVISAFAAGFERAVFYAGAGLVFTGVAMLLEELVRPAARGAGALARWFGRQMGKIGRRNAE